ncbi:unannotated protein [freshwater metagenome]|uniref:Unannotated protein n=1 Tax=freshwater metagenome TaxID=449393 RepID=A0A6J7IE45_9ZZZZ|nr:hypothetical protein [Actinomycetota bacterium]
MSLTIEGANASHTSLIEAFLNRHKERLESFAFELEIEECQSKKLEAFQLVAHKSNKTIEATLSVSSQQSLRWALNALLVFAEGPDETINLEDSPAFAIRGVIEGFYGTPWTHEQRLSGIESFADFGMNSFMLAPKDSPWQRFDWRRPFDSMLLKLTKELVERGQLHGVNIAICVSPGLSVKYSDQNDVEAVMIRYRQLLSIGVRDFGLLFDDIPWELQFAEDIKKYKTTAQAQADFSNRVLASLKEVDSSARLIVCPMEYCGRGTNPYIRELGTNAAPEISLMWTGRQICSEYLDISDAIVFKDDAGRAPLYWDNYPVNDVAMTHELHVGPIQGREAGLEDFSAGLFSNPMEKFEMSLLPLSTIGDYLWDSKNYNPQESWDRALKLMVKKESDYTAMRRLLRNSLGSCLNGNAAPDLGSLISSTTTAWRAGKPEEAAEIFRKAGEQIMRDYEVLTSDNFSRTDLIEEIKPWVAKYLAGGETLEQLSMVLAQCTWSKDHGLAGTQGLASEVLRIRQRFDQIQSRLMGDGLDLLMGELYAELKANEGC